MTQEPRPDQKYIVQLCINGKMTQITLDDYFVWNPTSKKFKFSHTNQEEIWVQLLEKAWAKACGSYAQTIGGITSESLRALTGAPTYNINHSEIDV